MPFLPFPFVSCHHKDSHWLEKGAPACALACCSTRFHSFSRLRATAQPSLASYVGMPKARGGKLAANQRQTRWRALACCALVTLALVYLRGRGERTNSLLPVRMVDAEGAMRNVELGAWLANFEPRNVRVDRDTWATLAEAIGNQAVREQQPGSQKQKQTKQYAMLVALPGARCAYPVWLHTDDAEDDHVPTPHEAVQGGASLYAIEYDKLSDPLRSLRIRHPSRYEPLDREAADAGEASDGLPLAVCERWFRRRKLLLRLARRRAYFAAATRDEPMKVTRKVAEALQSLGFVETASMEQASVVVPPSHAKLLSETADEQLLWHSGLLGDILSNRERVHASLLAMASSESCASSARDAATKYSTDTFVLPAGNEDINGVIRETTCNKIRKSMVDDSRGAWVRILPRSGSATKLRPAGKNDLNADCAGAAKAASAVWLRVLPSMRFGRQATSLRAYVLIASVTPLVAFVNFDGGHVFLADAGTESPEFQRAGLLGYEAHAHAAGFLRNGDQLMELGGDHLTSLTDTVSAVSVSHLSLEHLDMSEHVEEEFKPGMKAALAAHISAAAAAAAASSSSTTSALTPRAEILCADFVLTHDPTTRSGYAPKLVDISRHCAFSPYSEREPVMFRHAVTKDAVELALEVHGRLLRDASLSDLLDAHGRASRGRFELLHWDASFVRGGSLRRGKRLSGERRGEPDLEGACVTLRV